MLVVLLGFVLARYEVVAAGNYMSIDDGTFFWHTDITKPVGNCAFVTNSLFLFCSCQTSDGGAILFSNNALNATLYVANCVFQQCTTTQSGGAIYARAMDIKILTTCAADHCACGVDGNALLLEQAHGRADFNSSSVVDAGTAGSGDAAVYLRTTTSIVSGLNCTNALSEYGTSFLKLGSTFVSIGQSTCVGSNGVFAITLLWSPELCDISKMNVVGNSATGALIFFNGAWEFEDMIFAKNSEPYTSPAGSTSTLLFKSCVFDITLTPTEQVKFDSGCKFNTETATHDFEFLETALCHAVHTCTPAPTTAGPTAVPEENVWNTKSVIGGLIGGFVCSLLLGIFLGVMYKRQSRRGGDVRESLLSMSVTPYTAD